MTKDEALKLALEALELALSSHGVLLLSDPPQEAWKTRQVTGKAKRAITEIKAALAQPEQTHSQNPKFTMDEWAAHARKHQWRFDEEPVTGITTSAQSEQEPVAWSTDIEFDDDTEIILPEEKGRLGTAGMTIPLYTSPPKRQPLTDKQIEAVYENASGQELRPQDYRIVLQFARAIEAKLKEKNAC